VNKGHLQKDTAPWSGSVIAGALKIRRSLISSSQHASQKQTKSTESSGK